MPNIAANTIDDKLLGLLQTGFPLTAEPYSDLGSKLGVTGEEVIRRITALKANGIVRQISPVLDARKLGYQSTLIAMKVGKWETGLAEKTLSGHPGVSHAYERDHEFNIWFTLSMPLSANIETELQKLSSSICAEAVFTLPAVRVFKLRTNFGPDEDNHIEDGMSQVNALSERVELSEIERKVINVIQEDLPLSSNPFRNTSKKLDISVDDFLGYCRSLLRRGVIRRYGASINHYKAGYRANAMTCWKVPHDIVETVAAGITSLRQVSHCYERETNSSWSYNLYVMIHGCSKTGCIDTVNKIRAGSGISDYAVLFSTREFKKTRIRYLV
jgi:DNA-binding Lrp family transcriptional regulator